MASSDAKPFPIKNQAYRVYFPLLDADGDLVEGMAGLDSEVSKDGAIFANCTNEATEILTIVHDVNDTTNSITSPNATNQTTLNTLLNEIKTDYNAHRVSTTFHDAADSTNAVTSADATDAATSVTLANEIKTDYNAHRSQADVHPHDDSANEVTSTDATNEATSVTLANEIKTDYNAHLVATSGSGMAYLDLTSTEMNADATAIVAKSSTTGAKTTPIVLYPVEDTDIPVNVSAIGGVVQSLTDFKDFVDNGYDPGSNWVYANVTALDGSGIALDDLADFATDGYNTVTNKIAGVELVDVTTTNTDMVSGFSTHSAADIWSVVTRSLTDKSDFGLSTASINLIWDDLISGMTEVGSIGKLIADNLNATITSRAIPNEYDTQMGYIPSNLGDVPIASELNSDHGAGSWATATGFSTHTAIDIWSVATRILTASTNFNDLSAVQINTEVDTALADIKLDHLLNIAVDTNWATTVHLDSVIGQLADVGTSTTFDRTTDSQEAIRDRGDTAWMTATGFSTHSAANVWSVVTRSLTDKSGFALSTAGIKAIWDQLINVLTTVGSTGKLLVDNINATISSRSPASEYDTEMARVDVDVSSRNAIAPNIVIPDIAGTAATLHGITDGKIDVMDAIVDAIKAKTDNLPSGITKNEALPKFDFLMVLTSDHITAATGKTITGEIMKDGNTFATITNTITEVSNGMYTIADGFTQEEMNADVITLQFSEGTCDTRTITLITN